MPRRALSYLLVAVASSLLTLGVVGASRGSASSDTVAASSKASADVPPRVLADLAKLDRLLTQAIDDTKSGGSVGGLIQKIKDGKLEIVDREMAAPIDGVKGSEWFRDLECVDLELQLASLADKGRAYRHKDIRLFLELAKRCKQTLENDLHKATPPPPKPPPPPKFSLNTLHSFDLTQDQQVQLAIAATTPAGTDTTDPNLLNADAVIKNAYASNGFVGRHERDYVAVGVSNLSNPDSWPAGQSVRFFVSFDVFKTVAGAAAAAEASRLRNEAIKLARIPGSPLGLGEAVFQGVPVGTDVLSTIVVLQRGQIVVKIASACRGCPIGTVPADTATFVKAQVAQAEAKGLPK
jgi:hypothetical protein